MIRSPTSSNNNNNSRKKSIDDYLSSRNNNSMSSFRRRTLDTMHQKMCTLESVDIMQSDDDGIIETIAQALKQQQQQQQEQKLTKNEAPVIVKKLFLMHGITVRGASILKEALPYTTTLQVLKLLHNNEHFESLPILLQGVAQNSTITDLVLHDCPMMMQQQNNNDWNQHVAHDLVHVLHCNKTLKRLSLANIPSFGDEGATILAAGITESNYDADDDIIGTTTKRQQLKQLKLIRCGIDFRGAEALAQAIQSNSTLEVLDLEGNPIGDAGAIAFANALSCSKNQSSVSSSSLQTLNIGRNCEIGTIGMTALGRMLPFNNTLQELHLNGNPGVQLVHGKQALLDGLQINVTITNLGFCTVRPHARKRSVNTGSVVILPGMPNISEQIARQLEMNNIRSLFHSSFLLVRRRSKHNNNTTNNNNKDNLALMDKVLPYVLAKVSKKPSILYLFLQDYQDFLIPYL